MSNGDTSALVREMAAVLNDYNLSQLELLETSNGKKTKIVLMKSSAQEIIKDSDPLPSSSGLEVENNSISVKAPIVGTYYASPSPGSPAFVSVGSRVKIGDVLCIIESMKLINEVKSGHAGEVIDIFVKNGDFVEYGQALIKMRAVDD